ELDGRLPPPGCEPQITRVACRIERFRAERGEERVRLGGRLEPEERPEPARVAIAERDTRIEDDVEMFVRLAWRWLPERLPADGHSEMTSHRVAANPEREILASAIDAVDDASGEVLFERARNRPAKPPVVDPGGHDATADRERDEAPAGSFDFGQFGHSV